MYQLGTPQQGRLNHGPGATGAIAPYSTDRGGLLSSIKTCTKNAYTFIRDSKIFEIHQIGDISTKECQKKYSIYCCHVHYRLVITTSQYEHVATTVEQEIFAGAKFHGNASRVFRRNVGVFFLLQNECDTLTTPLPVDGHAPHPIRRNNTKQRSEEASLCNNSLP